MLQWVIFDCDGTLVDSEYLCNLGLELKLREKGVTEDAHSLMSRYRGWKLEQVLERLSLKYELELDEIFVRSYRQLVSELFDERLQPVEGVKEALSEISLPKGVASGGPPEKIKQALTLTGLANYFGDNIFSSYVVQSWKPEPGLFLYAAEAVGVQPEACAVVEDSLVGIEAALKAGMRPYLYDPQGLYEAVAQEVTLFKDMGQLPELLMGSNP
jgi:HAD superfamily hydrolase (TIGR01509 family)